jgi:nucleoside-diphosphate-sugar epimerase
MRIFLTGATGFIGTAVIPELLAAGHTVLGLARSDEGAAKLEARGIDVHRGDIYDLASLRSGAEQAEAVIHTAFNHDFSTFAENCATDVRVVQALGEVLAGSNGALLVTSGTAMVRGAHGRAATEHDIAATGFPREASETAVDAAAAKGVKAAVMRLPQVHDTHKAGLVTYAAAVAKQKGVSAYVGDGSNRWPAAHVSDVARLYRLAIEQIEPGARYHAVDEEGVAVKAIAEVVGKRLGIPTVSLTPEEAAGHFGWLGMFAGMDLPARSEWTRKTLGWTPTGPGMMEDLERTEF